MRIPISIVLNGKKTFNIIHVRERKRNAHGKPTKKRWSGTGGGFTTLREGHRHVYVTLDDLWCQFESNTECFVYAEEEKFDAFVQVICAVIDHEIVHYVEPLGAPHIMACAFEDVGLVVRGCTEDNLLELRLK